MIPRVSVDDREPATLREAVRAHPDIGEVAVRRLDAGDIVICDVGFERKTSSDYLSSALGRSGSDLRQQVQQMTEAYPHAYVLIEGDFDELEARWPGVADASIRGSMASITARLGVPVLPCGDRARLVDMAVRLARKHTEAPSTRPLSPSTVVRSGEPTAKRMYGCIEGIGPGMAETLYEVWPSVESLLAATQEDLLSVEGIGPKRAEAIYTSLRSSD